MCWGKLNAENLFQCRFLALDSFSTLSPAHSMFSFVAHFFCLVVGCVFYFQFVCIAISHTIFSWPVLFFQTSFAGLGSVLVMVSVDGE